MSDGDLSALIYRKNQAYHQLVTADVAISRAQRRGPIPATWAARRAELETAYRAALAACAERGFEREKEKR